MEKVYKELEEVKAENEKLRFDYGAKTDLLEVLKKAHNERLVEIREARSIIEKIGFESEEKSREISDLKRNNEDLQRISREKDYVIKRLNEANEKLRDNGEAKCSEFEEEKRKLVLCLDEASEKNIDMEQRNNVYRAEIEGLKGLLESSEKKKKEAEKALKGLREIKGRDDAMNRIEEEKSQVEEKLKWKKEHFKHLEEAYEKLKNLFQESKKEWEDERRKILDEIYSLQTKLDSETRISEDLDKKLKLCNSVLTQEETRRKHLEIRVSELESRYEDAFAECRDAKTQLDDLSAKRDEEVADLRHSLTTKEAYFKEMKYEKGKLEQENRELLVSLKEIQEATIQGSGNSAITKLKNRFRNLENIHKSCSSKLRSKEAEWVSQMEKISEEINDYKSKLQAKEAAMKEIELELENFHSSTDTMRVQYEEISVMFLVLSRTISEAQSRLANVKDEQINDEKREEEHSSLLVHQLEHKNVLLTKALEEIESERERVSNLLKRIEILEHFEEESLRMEKEEERYKETVEEASRFTTQMKEKMLEAEKDYEEKLMQVCDALDNINSDLVAERDKVVSLTRKVESFGAIEEKNLLMNEEVHKHKEMLEESERSRVLLEERISQLESDSKENISELRCKVDIAYAKLAEEVEKNVSLIKKIESIDQNTEQIQRELEEATKNQLLLQEKVAEVENVYKRRLDDVSDTLETANCELSDKTAESYQLEFQLWVWKSVAKRLKGELEQSKSLRKRVEASLLEQAEVGEALRTERNALLHKLKASDSEKETLVKKVKDKDKILTQVQRDLELFEQESLTKELGDAVFASIISEREILSMKFVSLLVEQNQEKLAASKILTEVETEAKKLMIIELEKEVYSMSKELEETVSCLRQEATQVQEKLTSSEAEKAELVKQVSSLSSKRENLICFIDELVNGMSNICDGDAKLIKSPEKTMRFGSKKNNNVCSPRLVMKHEEDVVEERSPFRELNN
ncbi:unnamed protein product [Cochlearia groenlandica]